MPIYEYECKACGHQFEALQKMSDKALVDCPECHKAELKKLISAAGFRLSGGGWYETDFKTGSKKNVSGEGKTDAAAKKTAEKPAATEAKKPSSPKSD